MEREQSQNPWPKVSPVDALINGYLDYRYGVTNMAVPDILQLLNPDEVDEIKSFNESVLREIVMLFDNFFTNINQADEFDKELMSAQLKILFSEVFHHFVKLSSPYKEQVARYNKDISQQLRDHFGLNPI